MEQVYDFIRSLDFHVLFSNKEDCAVLALIFLLALLVAILYRKEPVDRARKHQ